MNELFLLNISPLTARPQAQHSHKHNIGTIFSHREISLAIGMLNVEPDDVDRIVQRLKHALHSGDVALVTIVPAALVVACKTQVQEVERER